MGFCDVHHPSGHGMPLCQPCQCHIPASSDPKASHPCPGAGNSLCHGHSHSPSMLGCGIAAQHREGRTCWLQLQCLCPPFPFPPAAVPCGRLGSGAHPGDTEGPQVPRCPVELDWDGHGEVPAPHPLPQPPRGVFKGLVKVKELIPMDFKLFSIF